MLDTQRTAAEARLAYQRGLDVRLALGEANLAAESRAGLARLAQAVERTLTLATNIVVVGLAIQTALSRQKRILDATQKTREFLGNMIADNANAIRKHTQEIGDVYNNPAIALDKIIEAHDQLLEALKMVDQLEKKGSESARQNSSTALTFFPPRPTS